jgi:hypothetical protein
MRDKKIIELRPELPNVTLPTIEDNNPILSIEGFQNQTLRPILKLQHDLLVAIFKHNISVRKNVFFNLPEKSRSEYISHTLRSDLKFKNRLIGVTIGHFTLEEYSFFENNEAELTRRMTDLLIQRLITTFAPHQ